MKIRHIIAGLAASVGLLVASNGSSSDANAASQYVMNFGTVAPNGTPWSDQLSTIKKRIEKESNGAIKIKLFLGGSLGSEIEMIQDVRRGERLQGGGFSTGAVGEALDIPVLQMVELPFLFKSNEHADNILDNFFYEPTQKALAEKGITFYAWTENGWRNFATVGGAAMPGGLGIADGALIGGAMQFILSPGLDVDQARAIATTAALLTRIATLWFGVGLGAIALLKVSSILKDYQADDDNDSESDDHEPLTTNDDEAH